MASHPPTGNGEGPSAPCRRSIGVTAARASLSRPFERLTPLTCAISVTSPKRRLPPSTVLPLPSSPAAVAAAVAVPPAPALLSTPTAGVPTLSPLARRCRCCCPQAAAAGAGVPTPLSLSRRSPATLQLRHHPPPQPLPPQGSRL
jgi:hypothetical protein